MGVHKDQVRPAGPPEASLEPWSLGRRRGSDPSSRICSQWSSLGGPGVGEEAGGEGGRGRASVHGISAGWRERGVRSQPGRLFPQPGAERAAMALARPGTPGLQAPGPSPAVAVALGSGPHPPGW